MYTKWVAFIAELPQGMGTAGLIIEAVVLATIVGAVLLKVTYGKR
jgi:hypothetical protein